MKYALGYDIGSSSIKAALVEVDTGRTAGIVRYPDVEMDIIAPQPGWAEQSPETWWQAVCKSTRELLQSTGTDPAEIGSIGIAYQMHGLVAVDSDQRAVRPSIIWCDSRAVEIGEQAFDVLGKTYCLSHMLNSPGNFTASKLKWVRDNEPEVYGRIHRIMLPGDYIAMRLTGEIRTTVSGLSEGILWDFQENDIAQKLLEYYGLAGELIPGIVGTCAVQGTLTQEAAQSTGLAAGTVVSYRAGDQPNNALSLGVIRPDEVAATGGTSGVVYGVVDRLIYDDHSRINGFAHVNHTQADPRIGLLLCINGAGIQYAWMKHHVASEALSYHEMERMCGDVPVGSDGLRILPFGNGAERMLLNANPGARITNLHFNRHTRAHLFRAALEGIAFSFVYGFSVMRDLGLQPEVIRVGNDNLFQSSVFSRTVSTILDCPIEIRETTGAVGAARASTVAVHNVDLAAAMGTARVSEVITPGTDPAPYRDAYHHWESDLNALKAR